MQIGDIARLVAFVLPGYVAIELRNFLVRTKKRDNFERLASSLFISLIAYTLAACVMRLAYRDDWKSRTTICLANWFFVGVIFFFAILLGYAIARLTTCRRLQDYLYKHHVDLTQYPNVWNEIWHSERGAPWAIVRMRDGSECLGAIRAYSVDPDDPYRELWLNPVAKRADPEAEPRIVPGLSLYVPGDQISSVSVYRPDDQPTND